MKICRTTQRTLQILEAIALTPRGMSLKELGDKLSIPKTSLFDIVSTLVEMNYLRKHNKLFHIGAKSKEVGDAYIKKQDLCDNAVELLTQASELFNTSTSLVFLSHNNLEYAFQHHPSDAVMVARHPSPYNFLHASASGKVILAHMSGAHCEKLMEKQVFHRFTDRTIKDIDELREELKAVKQQGYALDNREYHYLLQCVAAPVFNRGKAIAAISFSGLNLYNDDPSVMIANVLATARSISESYS